MITIEKLNELGVDTKEGLARCMNNEKFYIKMVTMGIKDAHFEMLEKAIADKNLEEAFESAHALKGIIGNLAIAPIYNPLNRLTEMLRAKMNANYAPIYKPIKDTRDKILNEL